MSKPRPPVTFQQHVGEGIVAPNGDWHFRGETARQFSAHVRRSVPYYDDGHELVVKLSDYFIGEHSLAYELGVATGALIARLAAHHPPTAQWVGIDAEADMIAQARRELAVALPEHDNITLVAGDICLQDYAPCDMQIAYYTLQFVPPRLRQDLFDRIYQSLNWGGAFVLFEKVRGPDARFQDILTGLYTDYKLEQGYDGTEIIAKSRALKGILEPFSEQGNIDLMRRAGFSDIMCIFRYLCFAGFVAIK